MARRALRRCSVCGKFHAAYLAPLPDGAPGFYCRSCWNALCAPGAPPLKLAPAEAEPTGADPAAQPDPPPERR